MIFGEFMKIQFLGTGAAEGVPAEFCNCDFCKSIREVGESEFRTRAQVLIDGVLSIDFPPDAYYHSLKFGVNLSDVKYLLVTHSHMDHFYAHDFILRGYKYAQLSEDKLEIYGNAEVKKVFDECTAREMKSEVSVHVGMTEIKPFAEFCVGEYKVLTIPANHSKQEDALLYFIERKGRGYLHLYDTGPVSDDAIDFLAKKGIKANLVCFDCTFIEREGGAGARHMGIPDNLLLEEKLLKRGIITDKTKIIVSHFSHAGKPTRAHLREIEEKYNVTAAYDGMIIEI